MSLLNEYWDTMSQSFVLIMLSVAVSCSRTDCQKGMPLHGWMTEWAVYHGMRFQRSEAEGESTDKISSWRSAVAYLLCFSVICCGAEASGVTPRLTSFPYPLRFLSPFLLRDAGKIKHLNITLSSGSISFPGEARIRHTTPQRILHFKLWLNPYRKGTRNPLGVLMENYFLFSVECLGPNRTAPVWQSYTRSFAA